MMFLSSFPFLGGKYAVPPFRSDQYEAALQVQYSHISPYILL